MTWLRQGVEEMEKKGLPEVRQELHRLKKEARFEGLRMAGQDVDRVISHETALRERIKETTMLLLDITRPRVKDNAAALACLPERTPYHRMWSLPDLPPKGPSEQFIDFFDPLGRMTVRVGSVDFWNPFTELQNCINGRTEIDADPTDAAGDCRAERVNACCGNGYAVATGETGITHTCSVQLKHDFHFAAPQDGTFSFWPEFTFNGNAAVTGQAVATVRIHVAVAGAARRSTAFYARGNYSGAAWGSSYTADPPRVKRPFGAGESADVTITCELHVEADDLSSAILDFDADENHYLCSAVLHVDVLDHSVPLYDRPDPILVLEEPYLREIELPHMPPLFREGVLDLRRGYR
jgi:hypothetical protein